MSDCQAGGLEISPERVVVYDSQGEEVIYWDCAEWAADPSVAVAIFRMINLFHTLGPDRLRDELSSIAQEMFGAPSPPPDGDVP